MPIKRKLLAVASAAIVAASVFSGAYADDLQPYSIMVGDINRDNTVNVSDVVAMSYCLTGKAVLIADDLDCADMNMDGYVDSFDLVLLRKTVIGLREIKYIQHVPVDPVDPTLPSYDPTEKTVEIPTEPATELPTEPLPTDPTEPPVTTTAPVTTTEPTVTTTVKQLDITDMPSEYEYALDWVWENRIQKEDSTGRWNTIFDQIDAGNGTLNYVVRWQSYKTLSLEQRQQFAEMIENSVNAWTDYLVGYDGWAYDHIDVKIVGWAVLDESTILDRQPDEIIYTDLTDYDSSGDTSNGREEIPDKLPNAPDELSRMYHYSTGIGFDYPGGLDKRFDMYMWATQGWPDIGGCGGDWGQRLSDNAYLNMLDGTGVHVFEHELGHGFGITDFYGGEGESNGFPPGGFPEPTIMMAGNSAEITNYDGWQLRYIWSKIKDQTNSSGENRFK